MVCRENTPDFLQKEVLKDIGARKITFGAGGESPFLTQESKPAETP